MRISGPGRRIGRFLVKKRGGGLPAELRCYGSITWRAGLILFVQHCPTVTDRLLSGTYRTLIHTNVWLHSSAKYALLFQW